MTSEYVSLGHPDKVADYISEYILDQYLKRDPATRYAVEVQLKDNFVSLAGEVTSLADYTQDEIAQFVRDAICDIGYTHDYALAWGAENTLDGSEVIVVQHISRQSPDIAVGVDNDGWGDQGIFWGMAVNDPEHDYMPLDHWYARKIGKHLFDNRFGGLDIKTQVTVKDGKATECVVAIPLMEERETQSLKEIANYVKSVLGSGCRLIINGTGSYVIHSSFGDCGTTGRKLAVDFYGGNCRIGGGSPWTKDPTKADLTLNLYARKIAKDYIIETGAQTCFVAISCAIGRKRIVVEIYDGANSLVKSYVENKSTKEVVHLLGLDKACFAKLCRDGLTYGND